MMFNDRYLEHPAISRTLRDGYTGEYIPFDEEKDDEEEYDEEEYERL